MGQGACPLVSVSLSLEQGLEPLWPVLGIRKPSLSFLNLFLIGGMIALQGRVGFCHTIMWISHKYTLYPLCLESPSQPLSPSPPRLSQSTGSSSLCYTAAAHWLSISHMGVYVGQCCSQFIPPLSFPAVPTSLFSKSVSIPALQRGSLVPFFQIPYICINIWYLPFIFWLHSV